MKGRSRDLTTDGRVLLTRILLLAFSILSCTFNPTWAQVKVAQEYTTEHFSIRTGQKELPRIEEILEQFYDHLAEFFEAEPKDRLRIVIFDSQEEFEEEFRRNEPDGAGEDFGGLYSHRTNTAYLWSKTSEERTRATLLHEVTHAFHSHVTGSGRFPADWYIEGLAHYFEMHCWNGTVLQTGIRPVISREDWPAQALEALEERNLDLSTALSRTFGSDQAESWAIVHFLLTHYPEKLRQLGFTTREPKEAWEMVFGPLTPRFVDAYRLHLLEIQQPWTVIWGTWKECSKTITGSSRGVGLVVLKETPDLFTAEIAPSLGTGLRGLVVAFQSPDDYHLFTVADSGLLRIEHIALGGRETTQLLHDRRQEPAATVVLSAEKRDNGTRLFSEGKLVATLPLQGQVGLLVYTGTISFNTSEVMTPQAKDMP